MQLDELDAWSGISTAAYTAWVGPSKHRIIQLDTISALEQVKEVIKIVDLGATILVFL